MIHEDGATKWDASVLAERVGLSRTRFFARFSELVGEPPAQYISKWRMSAAADALVRADVTVSELAERTGYGSEDAFVRVFKRTFGKTPSAYRRSFRDSA
jgi:AraC-like DNA-binding protein